MTHTTLYRPVGPKELHLLELSGFKRWPPRLPDQPIFYPVTNEAYATQIARDWNLPRDGAGYVTEFQVLSSFMSTFKVQCVGSSVHTEWWIPAEDLERLNDNIHGLIRVIASFEPK